METKTIKVSDKNWKKLMKLKIDLGYKNVDEVIMYLYKNGKEGK